MLNTRQIADLAGVTPQAVTQYCRRHFKKTGGRWALTAEQEAQLLEFYGIEKPDETANNEENAAKPAETTGFITLPVEVYDALMEQLRVKDEQIASLLRANEAREGAAAAGAMRELPEALDVAPIEKPKRSRFRDWFR